MKFSIKNFFSKYDQIRRKLRISSDLLKKSSMENFIFCAVLQLVKGIWRDQELLLTEQLLMAASKLILQWNKEYEKAFTQMFL